MAQEMPTDQPEEFDQAPGAQDAPADQDAPQMAQQALDDVSEAAQAIQDETGVADSTSAYELPSVEQTSDADDDQASGLALLSDVTLKVKIELGRTKMYVEDVLKLNADAVIELDKAAGDPVDIFVNDRLVARGEVLVLNENFCVRISEIINQIQAEAV